MDENLEILEIEDNNTKKNKSLSLELGDIIEIIAPSNEEINEMTYLLTQISDKKIILMRDKMYTAFFDNSIFMLFGESSSFLSVLAK